jgi:hypothetical protein
MSTTRSFVKIGTVATAGIIGACATTGVALACNVGDGSNSAASTVTAAGAPTVAVGATALSTPRLLALAHSLEHGQLTMATTTGSDVVDVQAGTVTTVDPTNLTVTSADGFTASYVLASSTKIEASFGWHGFGHDGSSTATPNAAASATTKAGTLHAGDKVDLVALKGTGVVQVVQDLGAKVAAPTHSTDVRRWGQGR